MPFYGSLSRAAVPNPQATDRYRSDNKTLHCFIYYLQPFEILIHAFAASHISQTLLS